MNKSENIHDRWVELKKLSDHQELSGTQRAEITFKRLTLRQREVAKHLIEGHTNKMIANDLGLKVVTVKLPVRNILKLLKVKNRTQAALHLHEMQQRINL